MTTRYDQMREQTIRYHLKNPLVWQYFCKFTFEIMERGFKNYSSNAIFERIRWETDQADTEGQSTFKVSNNHRAFYARAFMKKYPEHAGFFRLREQTSKNETASHLPPLGPDDYPEVAA